MRTLPPMPIDSSVCRWCGCRRVLLSIGVWHCPSGCSANDVAPYARTCVDCRRQFETGRRFADQCWACAATQQAAIVAEFEVPSLRGYEADMLKKGVGREAFAMLPQDETARQARVAEILAVLRESA